MVKYKYKCVQECKYPCYLTINIDSKESRPPIDRCCLNISRDAQWEIVAECHENFIIKYTDDKTVIKYDKNKITWDQVAEEIKKIFY